MNYKNGRTLKTYKCKGCKKIIPYRTALYKNGKCKSCCRKGIKRPNHSKRMKGKNHPNYKDGRTNKKYKCKDCETKIDWQTATRGKERCHSCASKYMWTNKKFRENLIKKISGKNNYNYIHGKGYEPYSSKFNQTLKKKIRERDNYECRICNMIEEEHIIVYGRALEIHHIDYNKENCNGNNLITTCKQCNMRANFNRKYWKKYFQSIVGLIK